MALLQGLSGDLWPIHLKPYEDELLSSWMVRLARAYGVEPVKFWNGVSADFTDLRWPILDYMAPERLLSFLSQVTATPPRRIVETTLLAIGSVQFIPRINPLLRYCPVCLSEEPEAYYRRRWQMNAFRICGSHRCLLCCDCPNCRRPQSLSSISLDAESISSCSHCGAELSAQPPLLNADVTTIQQWQERLWNCVSEVPRELNKASHHQIVLVRNSLRCYLRSRRRRQQL